ncbi:DUF6146 family protein [Cellulophaga sp. Z1A5H]|uniref:DUF6146 family protein n=1 Tax=Cellulophaga sp. Z1A5H TaxID=2687291 RepID=UPI0013FE23C7|nr:DUF6146 family protein [Cellulophaga sp. Z1A5H]
MKNNVFRLTIFIAAIILLALSCTGTKTLNDVSDKENEAFHKTKGDTITIADDESDYEIIIIEPGFNFWLQSIAKSEGYYSQNYLENRNAIWVLEWNQRVQQPQRFDPNLYEMSINYNSFTDYGYEVNYKLYNYFIYFQRKYNQRLGSFYPRI